jgi:hypothetical protein
MGDAEQNTSGRDSSGRQNNSISTVVKDFDYDLTMLNGVCAPKVGGCRKNYVCSFICSVDVDTLCVIWLIFMYGINYGLLDFRPFTMGVS